MKSVTIKEPFKREAQIYLAKEITFLVHGKKGLDDALRQTEGLNKGNWEVLKNTDYEDLYKNSDKSSNLSREKIDEGITIQHLTVEFDLCKSLGESKRLISQGGISINGNKILDPEKNITYSDLKADKVIIISKGKKTHKIITVD